MSDLLDWHVGEDAADEMPPETPPDPQRPFRSGVGFWLATAVLAAVLLGTWAAGRGQVQRAEANWQQQVQRLLDLQQRAVQQGDGDLFFSVMADDAAFRAAQLLPANVAAHRAGFTATRARLQDGVIRANLRWTANERTYQRVAFYAQRGGELRHIPTATDYWGGVQAHRTLWGELKIHAIDADFVPAIIDFVQVEKARLCRSGCLDRDVTLVVTDDWGTTAVSHTVHVPSPRLLGLDATGAPSDLFWGALRRELAAALTPATIRFGIPAADFPLVDYERAAAAFMAQHPHVTVELVALPTAVPTMADLAGLDGAAITPSPEMLAAGFVHDLTDYLRSDRDFAQTDFYEQIWRGAWWQDRFWMMPQAGQMRVLFYDRSAYRQAERPLPSLRWTWAEMAADAAAVTTRGAPTLSHGLLDVGNDLLFSYAYNWQNACPDATVRCLQPLSPDAVSAALRWYQQEIDAGQMVDLPRQTSLLPQSPQDTAARNAILSNWQSAQRRAVIWVDDPLHYELRLLLDPVGIAPFPGSDRFDGVTPLWVHGHVILQQSERPLAVWQWLTFLSYYPPSSRYRYVPARPSVARQSGYWATLPRPLGESMRAAFPFARPVLIAEQDYFKWDLVTAVGNDTLTPEQAARRPPTTNWFTTP